MTYIPITADDDSAFVELAGTQTITGSKTFTGTPIVSGVPLRLRDTPTTTTVLSTRIDVDSADTRFNLHSGGRMLWGDGVSAPDVYFERSAAGILKMNTGDKWQQNAAPTAGDDLVNRTYADGVQTFTGLKTFEGSAASTVKLQARVTADANPRFQVQSDGKLLWGDGTAAADANLHRLNAGPFGIFLATENSIGVDGGLGFVAVQGASLGFLRSSDADSAAFQTNLTADTGPRIFISTLGQITVGDGAGVLDANLYRNIAGFAMLPGWRSDYAIRTPLAPVDDTDLTNKLYVDANGVKRVPISAIKVANYTLTTADYMVPFNSTAAIRTATLPTAPANGTTFIIKDGVGQAGTSNKITVAAGGAETIDGVATRDLITDWESMTVTYHAATTNWLRS